MPNIRLIVEYDGSSFHGWQMQAGVPTVQSELSTALTTVLRCGPLVLHASGRTDTGVHARGQVVTFRLDSVPDFPRLMLSVSSILRGRLAILAADVAPDDFHPRERAISKQYSYKILNRNQPATFQRNIAWQVPGNLDFELIAQEIKGFIGRHDFSSYRAVGCSAASPVREIFEAEAFHEGQFIVTRFVGEGFLRNMVRIMVGTLVDIGSGALKDATIASIMAARSREAAGVTAPAHGLCLDWVKY